MKSTAAASRNGVCERTRSRMRRKGPALSTCPCRLRLFSMSATIVSASAGRPCVTSQRGLSGIHMRITKMTVLRSAPIANAAGMVSTVAMDAPIAIASVEL